MKKVLMRYVHHLWWNTHANTEQEKTALFAKHFYSYRLSDHFRISVSSLQNTGKLSQSLPLVLLLLLSSYLSRRLLWLGRIILRRACRYLVQYLWRHCREHLLLVELLSFFLVHILHLIFLQFSVPLAAVYSFLCFGFTLRRMFVRIISGHNFIRREKRMAVLFKIVRDQFDWR